MTARLIQTLKAHRLTYRSLADGLALSPSTITHWLTHGRRPQVATRETVQEWLEAQGVPQAEAAVWDQTPPPNPPQTGRAEGEAVGIGPASPTGLSTDDMTGDNPMLLPLQPVHQAALAHFGLRRDPFAQTPQTRDQVFSCPDIAYVRETLWDVVAHGAGQLLAVIGQSGSGKTTLLDDIEQRIVDESAPYVLVRPDVTGMEASDTRGRLLRVAHIQEAVIHALLPEDALRQSPEARARQMRDALIAARDAGQRVTIAVDEGHAAPGPFLRHCKRLLEIKRGLTQLLSIIILGQPELGNRLSERNPTYREVVARCQVVHLDPLDDQLERYLSHRLAPAGRQLADLIDQGGLDALRAKLRIGVVGETSWAYPLLVHNLFGAALNLAAIAKAPKITAGVIGKI